jgi:hypothetical protein
LIDIIRERWIYLLKEEGRKNMDSRFIPRLFSGTIFLAVIAISIVGCRNTITNPTPTPLPQGVVHDLGYATAETLAVALGDTIIFCVGEVGPGGFEAPAISSAAVCFDKNLPVLQNPGGPTEKLQFIACNRGIATITISHTVKGIVYTLTVVVS